MLGLFRDGFRGGATAPLVCGAAHNWSDSFGGKAGARRVTGVEKLLHGRDAKTLAPDDCRLPREVIRLAFLFLKHTIRHACAAAKRERFPPPKLWKP